MKNFNNPLLKTKKAFQHAMCKNVTKFDISLILSVYFQKFGILETKILFRQCREKVWFFFQMFAWNPGKKMYLQRWCKLHNLSS